MPCVARASAAAAHACMHGVRTLGGLRSPALLARRRPTRRRPPLLPGTCAWPARSSPTPSPSTEATTTAGSPSASTSARSATAPDRPRSVSARSNGSKSFDRIVFRDISGVWRPASLPANTPARAYAMPHACSHGSHHMTIHVLARHRLPPCTGHCQAQPGQRRRRVVLRRLCAAGAADDARAATVQRRLAAVGVWASANLAAPYGAWLACFAPNRLRTQRSIHPPTHAHARTHRLRLSTHATLCASKMRSRWRPPRHCARN